MTRILVMMCVLMTLNVSAQEAATNKPQSAVLALSVQDCLELALGGNMDLRIGKYRVQSAAFDELIQQEAYTGVLQLDLQDINREGPTPTTLGGAEVLEEDERLGELALRKKWTLGTQTDLIWLYRKNESNSEFYRLNPSVQTATALEFTQPLLQGFGFKVNQAELKRARNNWSSARDELEIQVEAELLSIFSLYWGLVDARFEAELRQKEMDIAELYLQKMLAQYEVGEMTQLEVVQAKASAASAKEALQVSKSVARSRGERLMSIIKPPEDPTDFAREKILPTSLPPMTRPDKSVDDWKVLFGEAMENRPELRLADVRLDNADLDVIIAKDRTRPRVDLYGSFRLEGLAEEFSQSRDQVKDSDFPNWEVGARLSRLFNKDVRKAGLNQMMYARDAEELRRKQLVQEIVLEVRDARDNLDSALKQSMTTELTLVAAEKDLLRETDLLEVGRSTALAVAQKGAARLRAELAHIRASSRTLVALALLESSKGTFARDLIGQETQ